VESIIKKTVKEGIQTLVKDELKQLVVPLLTKKLKTVDDQVNTHVMPKIEEHLQKLLKDLVQNGSLTGKGNGEDVTAEALQ